jgi:hypothetical protein
MALPTNSGSSILSAIPSLVQLFIGSGKQTGTKTTTSAKSASSASTNALTSILGQAAPNTNAAVQNAIDLMFRQGMPSIGSAERGSGIYNSSATKENVNQLGATAAAKAAELDLNQQNKATDQKIAAAGTLGQLTATDTMTQTGTEQTGAAIDPMMAALGIGGLMLGSKLMKGFGSDSTSAPAASNIDFTPTVKTPDLGSIFDINFESAAGSMAEGLKSSTFDPTTGGQVTGGGSEFLGVLQDVASNSLLSGIGDFFGGLFGGSSGGKDGPVICTRIYELGYLDDDTYLVDRLYGYYLQATSPKLVAWYHSWAIPFVANWLHGRTLASKVVIQVMRPIVAMWSAYMKHQVIAAAKKVVKVGAQWQV